MKPVTSVCGSIFHLKMVSLGVVVAVGVECMSVSVVIEIVWMVGLVGRDRELTGYREGMDDTVSM